MNVEIGKSRFREIYGPFFGSFVVLNILMLCSQGLGMLSPYIYGRIIDGFVTKTDFMELRNLALSLCFILLVKNVVDLVHGYVHVAKVGYDFYEHLSTVTLRSISKLSLGQIVNHNSGFKHDILTKGEEALSDIMELAAFEVSSIVVRLIAASIGLCVLNIYLGLVTLAGIVTFVGSSIFINKMLLPEMKRLNKIDNRISTFYWEMIKHLRLIIIHAQEERAVREYRHQYEDYSSQGKKLWNKYFIRVTFFREPFASVGQYAVLLVGINLLKNQSVTPGVLVTAMAWSMTAFQTVQNAGSLQRRLARNWVKISRYFSLLNLPPSVKQVEQPIRPDKIFGTIQFENVSFEYPTFKGLDDDAEKKSPSVSAPNETGEAVKDISFTIPAGTTCALVGHSGAGKSTIINLLLRGYDPDKGRILIDGHDLRKLDLGLWRSAIGCVEQDPKLWDQTLRYNMTYGLNGHGHEVTDSDLHQLAARTRIDEFYTRLNSNPFDTEIGENGVQLSGGQRQRVAIARAIAKSPSVIILDEATNALDTINERHIHQAINQALVGRTGIIIAHRLSTIRHVDQIIVFDKGRVVGIGKHNDLMQECTAYRERVEIEVGSIGDTTYA